MFDKDGTLFDFQSTWRVWATALIERLSAGDPDVAQALSRVMGFDRGLGQFAPESPVIAETTDHVARLIWQEMGGPGVAEIAAIMDQIAADTPQVGVCPLVPVFEQLTEAGLTLGIATNDSEAPARAHLAQAGLTGHFTYVAGADSGHGAKPAPGQLLAFCDETGLAPGQVAMVGDSLHDLEAAKRAGMTGIAVLTGVATREDLQDHAAAVLPSIADLPDCLGISTA